MPRRNTFDIIDPAIRQRADTSRAAYVKEVEALGFGFYICKCTKKHLLSELVTLPGTGRSGITGCRYCRNLVNTLLHIYPCDECTEPTLCMTEPPDPSIPLLCPECKLDLNQG